MDTGGRTTSFCDLPIEITSYLLQSHACNKVEFRIYDMFGHRRLNEKVGRAADPKVLRLVCKQWNEILGKFPCDDGGEDTTCARAALHGNLALLQWAKQNGASLDEQSCWMAALGGHLHILKWLQENGIPLQR